MGAGTARSRVWNGMAVDTVEPSSVQAAQAPPPPPAGSYLVLSNERTTTYWAYVNTPGRIYVHPLTTSRVRTRTHLWTEDGFPEVYIVLREYRDTAGRLWAEIRIPGRPNGRMGWVLRSGLADFRLDRWRLVVNRRKLTLSAYYDGKLRHRAPVGIGKSASPTPAGHFWIRELFKIHNPSSGYYPYAFGTADYSVLTDWPGGGVVGIHGPYYQPQLIPGRISHGCIRLRVPDDAWVGTHVPVGTPLLVTP